MEVGDDTQLLLDQRQPVSLSLPPSHVNRTQSWSNEGGVGIGVGMQADRSHEANSIKKIYQRGKDDPREQASLAWQGSGGN